MRNLLLHLIAALAFTASTLVTMSPLAANAQGQAAFSGRWIDIDISNHTATAMEGGAAVFTAPVSAGRPGFDTPTGTFSILRRVFSETMDSSTIGIPNDGPGGYYLPGVMYTQYFTWAGHAIHGNYWANPSVFGNANTSHGCVGMANANAAYFWDFAGIGTPVVVHY
jgi:lipoprotein-anchoring transpeptidase ErfK/SrfK